MIEVWCAKAWKSLAPSRRKTLDYLKRLPSNRTGIAITVATPAVVVLWHLATLTTRPPHFDEIVSELGSPTIGRFATTIADHTGTRLVFMQGTENGYGLFFCRIGNGRKKLIDEDSYTDPGAPHQTLLGWSPDDHFFAFCRHIIKPEIIICDGDTGTTLATIPINDHAMAGAWLSSQTLAFANHVRTLFTIQHSQEKWTTPVPFKYFKDRSHKLSLEPIEGFMAFDANSVVYKQGNIIWRCDKDAADLVKIWTSETNRLIQFSYSQAANRLLINYQNTNGQFLADFYPGRSDELRSITKINTQKYHVEYLNLINDGKGYVFMSQIGTTNIMVTKLDDVHAPVQFQWPDQFSRFVPGQHEIFVTSSRTHGPTGIWKYDMASGSMECVVSRAEENVSYLTNATVEWNQITNTSGETLTYYLYVPSHKTSSKRHPLIIGIDGLNPVGFAWNANFQAFAECGYYFAYVERYQRGFSQWGEDVSTVYDNLVKNPDIDTNKVYLYGVSAGIAPVSELLTESPELWRGAALFSGVPNAYEIPKGKLLLDGGGDDPSFGRKAMRFQDAAAKAGTSVTLLIHPGLGHMLKGFPSAEKERLRETLLFFNNP